MILEIIFCNIIVFINELIILKFNFDLFIFDRYLVLYIFGKDEILVKLLIEFLFFLFLGNLFCFYSNDIDMFKFMLVIYY